ncbi:ParA family protein [Salisaeta longa]|uniref:ParA family protein n=1 Tax=Salisaeta longa TaxID=503170 RepID=UPI0003B3BE9F|nr:AAA family ATPase [Salisaeta longa]
MYTIAVVNQKGGVGKTTTTVALATFLHHRGYRVLVVDLDAQMNATKWMLGRQLSQDEASVYDSLVAKKKDRTGAADWPLADLIETSHIGFDFVPANMDLSSADAELANNLFLLNDRLEEVEASETHAYDFCLIDCPPSLGTLVMLGLTAADGMIVPIKADEFSMDGLGQLIKTAKTIKRVNQDLSILGILMNNLDWRFGQVKEGVAQLEDAYGSKLFSTKIPLRARIVEATAGRDLHEHASGTDVRAYYNALVDEVVERTGVGMPVPAG